MHTSRKAFLMALVFCALLLPAPARASWEVRGDAPRADFEEFHRRFSMASYHYPRHGAAPLGLIGFEIYADAAVDQDFGDEPFVETVLDDDPTGDMLVFGRVGARKGLPGGIDLGVAYGRAIEGDIKLVSADLQWAFIKGGVVSPALALRLTGTRTVDSGAYELDQYGAELLLSKGFTLVTPYIGAGVVRSEGTLNGLLSTLKSEETQTIFYGGVVINLLLPKIVVEVEKAEVVTGAVRLGFGF